MKLSTQVIGSVLFLFVNSAFGRALNTATLSATHNTSYIFSEDAFLADQPFSKTKTVGRLFLYSDLSTVKEPWIDLDEDADVYQGTLIKRATKLDFGFGYLLRDNLQIGFNIPVVQLETENNRTVNSKLDGSKTSGLGDSRLMAKWAFFENKNSAFALQPILFLPTGFQSVNSYYATSTSTEKTGIGASAGSFGLGFNLNYELRLSRFQLATNFGVQHQPNSKITGTSSVFGSGNEYTKVDHSMRALASISTLTKLTEKLGLQIEGSTFLNEKRNEYTQPGFGYAGLRWQWSEQTSIHGGYGGGLGEFTVEDTWLLGVKTPIFFPAKVQPNPPTVVKPVIKKAVKVVENRIEIDGVIDFESGSAVLTPRAREILDEVAETLLDEKFTYRKVNIAGHTDFKGSAAKNLSLSRTRALSAFTYLVEKGVPQQKLTHTGFGETRPIYKGEKLSSDELLKNRRVEFNIVR